VSPRRLCDRPSLPWWSSHAAPPESAL
jgi:hypothetical protein